MGLKSHRLIARALIVLVVLSFGTAALYIVLGEWRMGLPHG